MTQRCPLPPPVLAASLSLAVSLSSAAVFGGSAAHASDAVSLGHMSGSRMNVGSPSEGSQSSEGLYPQVTPPELSEGDGVYGRFDGDLNASLGVGLQSVDGSALGHAELALHYFSLSGIRVGYSDAMRSASVKRDFSTRVEIKPLFIPRWQADWERGPGHLDLILDSFTLGLGAFWQQPRGADFGDARGLEGSLGLGIPILPSAGGPWLEGALVRRWPDAGNAATVVSVNLSWHWVFSSGLH